MAKYPIARVHLLAEYIFRRGTASMSFLQAKLTTAMTTMTRSPVAIATIIFVISQPMWRPRCIRLAHSASVSFSPTPSLSLSHSLLQAVALSHSHDSARLGRCAGFVAAVVAVAHVVAVAAALLLLLRTSFQIRDGTCELRKL